MKIRRALKLFLYLLLLLLLIFAGFLAFHTFTEYKPAKEEVLEVNDSGSALPKTLDLITWNIGYFGLGSDMDFFYEGGTMVMPTREQYQKYSMQALERIRSFDSADFILLQEVDINSKRSYYVNECEQVQKTLPNHHAYQALNYKAWVPIPVTNPMGRVNAGLATFARHMPSSAKRFSYNSSYDWPTRLFQLKRCYLELRFPVSDGKELVLINTHNSAFDDGAALRKQELRILQRVMGAEYAKGNYVIVGGDWNINPPGFDSTTVLSDYSIRNTQEKFSSSSVARGWTIAFDSLHATNRYVNIPYTAGKTHSTLIDFFVLSPNIRLESVKTQQTNFVESDHQPVHLKVTLL